jgi:hypothetical protein
VDGNGYVEGLRTYLRSAAFLTAFRGLDPELRQRIVRSYVSAEALCESEGASAPGEA